MDEDEATRRLVPGTVSLEPRQWHWLEQRARASLSRSMAAELRRLIADAMEEEARRTTAAA